MGLGWDGILGYGIWVASIIVPITNNASNAIFCYNGYGPYMGDLKCADSKNWSYNNGIHYPNVGIPTNFTVENYEVFQVIKQ